MSRSAFSAHFTQAFGQSPHGFLTESRLRHAAYRQGTGREGELETAGEREGERA